MRRQVTYGVCRFQSIHQHIPVCHVIRVYGWFAPIFIYILHFSPFHLALARHFFPLSFALVFPLDLWLPAISSLFSTLMNFNNFIKFFLCHRRWRCIYSGTNTIVWRVQHSNIRYTLKPRHNGGEFCVKFFPCALPSCFLVCIWLEPSCCFDLKLCQNGDDGSRWRK